MVDTSDIIGGEYLNGNTTKQGDIVEVTGEGTLNKVQRDGKDKSVLDLPVKVNGEKELTYTPNKTALKLFKDKWNSADSKDWVGKKFSVSVVKVQTKDGLKDSIVPEPQ